MIIYMTIKEVRSSPGFSLVELMVALGIFGILALVGTNFLIGVIQSSNRSGVENETRQNQNKVYADVEEEIRKGACVYYNPSSPVTLNIADVNSGLNTNCSAEGNRVSFVQDDSGVVTKTTIDDQNVSVGPVTLTSPDVAVLDCKLAGSACGKASGCKPGLVIAPPPTPGVFAPMNLTVIVQQAMGAVRSDFCFISSVSGTISPRNF